MKKNIGIFSESNSHRNSVSEIPHPNTPENNEAQEKNVDDAFIEFMNVKDTKKVTVWAAVPNMYPHQIPENAEVKSSTCVIL